MYILLFIACPIYSLLSWFLLSDPTSSWHLLLDVSGFLFSFSVKSLPCKSKTNILRLYPGEDRGGYFRKKIPEVDLDPFKKA